jgi:DENN domain-containing protein 11
MRPLVDYWERHHIEENGSAAHLKSPTDSSQDSRPESQAERLDMLRRSRAFSDATALEMIRPALPPFHPALSLPDLMDFFGPLIFPLYKASLLRKRILLVADAPIQQPCDFGKPERGPPSFLIANPFSVWSLTARFPTSNTYPATSSRGAAIPEASSPF